MHVGIDVGGTFTDIAVLDSFKFKLIKIPTDIANPGNSIFKALETLRLTAPNGKLFHSSTVVTNMLLEHKGAKTAFVTSRGMRDILHIGRHSRPLNYAIRQIIPQQHYPPCPEELRFEVCERVDKNGKKVFSLNEEELITLANKMRRENVEAVGMGFLHSYSHPQNENKAFKVLQKILPEVFISVSSEVSPRFREFERFLTTAWNAKVAPQVVKYLLNLVETINKKYSKLSVFFMTSNGSLESINLNNKLVPGDLRRVPIKLALSGPAAAGSAIKKVAADLNINCCVGLDVGGTSSDIVVINKGKLKEAAMEDRKIGGYSLQIPMLDLHTIGAGGGSLIYRDNFGILHVGPESSGAYPGPACYDRGGTNPTLTDAAIISGRLPKDILLCGNMPVKYENSEKAFENCFGVLTQREKIKISLDALYMAESNIAFAIREKTVAKGIDPAKLTLVAAGGAGPLVACGIADMLDITKIVIPPYPGLLAAWGLLTASEKRENTISIMQTLDKINEKLIVEYFKRARQGLKIKKGNKKITYIAFLRYLGQGFEVSVNLKDVLSVEKLGQLFHKAHIAEYGYCMEDSPIEWIELRAVWERRADQWDFQSVKTENQVLTNDLDNVYKVWVLEHNQKKVKLLNATRIYRRCITQGQIIYGPAIIIEDDATICLSPGWNGIIENNEYLILTRPRK